MKQFVFLFILTILFLNCKTTSLSVSNAPKSYFFAEGRGAYDGDSPTIKVQTATGDTTYRIRLYGIDAPEHNSIYVDSTQPYSHESALWLRTLIKDKQVKVIPVYVDDFDRRVCRLVVDSVDVNELSVKLGHSWYRSEANMKKAERDRLKSYQTGANLLELGLWDSKFPIAIKPATWRNRYSSFLRSFKDRY